MADLPDRLQRDPGTRGAWTSSPCRSGTPPPDLESAAWLVLSAGLRGSPRHHRETDGVDDERCGGPARPVAARPRHRGAWTRSLCRSGTPPPSPSCSLSIWSTSHASPSSISSRRPRRPGCRQAWTSCRTSRFCPPLCGTRLAPAVRLPAARGGTRRSPGTSSGSRSSSRSGSTSARSAVSRARRPLPLR
ncbi:hypothetical protein [Ornithinimicrobium kibberense]|uniref:hypothetical protein n=1 Tax=Ornithinimicrobium kibberense TaxID=282060 RepID=UPI0036226CF8